MTPPKFHDGSIPTALDWEHFAYPDTILGLAQMLNGTALGESKPQVIPERHQYHGDGDGRIQYGHDKIIPDRHDFRDQTTSPYFASPYPIPAESTPALHSSLWRHAEEMVLSEHIVLAEGRQKPPKSLGDYRFVPVLHSSPDFLEHSISSVCTGLETSQGITFEYEKPGGTPFMDGRFGLGLAFRGRLVALCSGGIAEEGPIILQLQDVSNKIPPDTSDPKVLRSFAYSNGLRGGIDWKATLVRGWSSLMSKALPEILPETVGMPVWIQCARNNNWVNRQGYSNAGHITARYVVDQERLARFSATYNMTAHRLGGVLDPETRNCVLPASFAVGHTT